MEPICGGPLPLRGRGGQYPSRARSDPFPELSSIANRAAENNKKARRREPPGFAGLRREFRRHPPSCHCRLGRHWRSEEHTSELQSLMRTSYAVFCLKKKTTYSNTTTDDTYTYIKTLDYI